MFVRMYKIYLIIFMKKKEIKTIFKEILLLYFQINNKYIN